VSKNYRRLGIATEIIRLAQAEGDKRVYVSATTSGSAGFRLAEKPHPELFALEPEDIHMIKTF
jgi:hypothetical protein